jgi:hypothetical protein
VRPGEVRLVWFPFSHSEPQSYKKRPVLVLSVAGHVPDRAILIAMITSNGRRVRQPGPGDIVVADWRAAGLRSPSVVRTRRIWTAEDRDFTGQCLGTIGPATFDAVTAEVHKLLPATRSPRKT